jgi:hypothetical protein
MAGVFSMNPFLLLPFAALRVPEMLFTVSLFFTGLLLPQMGYCGKTGKL